MVTERSDEGWLTDLRGSGPRRDDACESLRALLVRRLGRALGDRGVDPARIEDFAQEALLRVLQSLPSYRGDSRFTTWATAIALRTAYTELRRARFKNYSLEAVGGAAWTADPAPSASDQLEREALFATLVRVVEQQLTPRQRAALLPKLEGVPQVTLADALGLSTNALYKLQHDARRKLRQGILQAGFTETDVRRILDDTSGEG